MYILLHELMRLGSQSRNGSSIGRYTIPYTTKYSTTHFVDSLTTCGSISFWSQVEMVSVGTNLTGQVRRINGVPNARRDR